MPISDKVRQSAEKIVTVDSVEKLPLKNMALVIATCELKAKGFYTCTIDGVKTLFELVA